jgi:hypothetical protein
VLKKAVCSLKILLCTKDTCCTVYVCETYFNIEINFDSIQCSNNNNIFIYSEGKLENKKKERRKEEKKKKEEVETSDEECVDTQGKSPCRI